jgi:hypothetical protein
MPRKPCPPDCELEPPDEQTYLVYRLGDIEYALPTIAICECGKPFAQVKRVGDDAMSLIRYDGIPGWVVEMDQAEAEADPDPNLLPLVVAAYYDAQAKQFKQ